MKIQPDTNLGFLLEGLRSAAHYELTCRIGDIETRDLTALIDQTIIELDHNPSLLHSNGWVNRRLEALRKVMP